MDITNKLSRVCEMNSTIWEAFKSSGFDCIIFQNEFFVQD